VSRYKAYSEYRDSQSKWLGDIPRTWNLLDGKRLFSSRREPALEDDEQLAASQKYGVVPQNLMMELNDAKVMLALKGTGSFRHVGENDFVISLRSFEGGIEHSSYVGCVSPAYTVLRAEKNIVPTYFKYLLKSGPYIAALQASTDSLRDGKSISYEQFGAIPLPYPVQGEQHAISAFLDNETAKIDALIEKQQRLIELLKEKRQAVISHAVTKGLNPNAPMKDSGVEWLGEVPAHWKVLQIRRVLSGMEQGKSPECESRPADIHEWGVLKTGCVNKAKYNSDENKYLPEHIPPFPQFEVKRGDVLMSRASGSVDLIGSVAYVHETRSKILLSDKIFRLHLSGDINKELFAYLMQSAYMRLNIKNAISGAEGMANNITKSSIAAFLFALPPMNEQNLIVKFVDCKLIIFNKLIDRAESAIDIFQERRTALISAAVTGKIDVRDWQPAAA
jgi:type I restriction enzyme S subunit